MPGLGAKGLDALLQEFQAADSGTILHPRLPWIQSSLRDGLRQIESEIAEVEGELDALGLGAMAEQIR